MNASWGNWKALTPDTFGQLTSRLPSFEINIAPVYDWPTGGEAAVVTVGSASWNEFEGRYLETTCFLLPAILQYDITIEHDAIYLPRKVVQGRVHALANNTQAVDQSPAAMETTQLDTIDAITVDAQLALQTNVSAVLNAASTLITSYVYDPLTLNQVAVNNFNVSASSYDIGWLDPMPDIVSTFNQLMFRGGVIASSWDDLRGRLDPQNITTILLDPGISIHQTVSAVQEITQTVFDSDLRWYVGAAIVQVVAALAILPMLWGWCHHTLSPFAIALAFDAPILKDVNSAAGAKGVVDLLGGMRLKYGIVDDDDAHDGRLESGKVLHPVG
ncbi:hypothetical protein LTR37_006016 [Vermiconidia calcicola]|uniref:Uncharacterized protein n=1 Tax=Vermiconidia calcicola TaxID=1690605 RepID=A0ACC3NHC4_9PEZI|nr:hypothetical protein LTR37_006016 [Vermiconidia calcicola]